MNDIPEWWPPKIGDRLRKYDHVQRGVIARLCHVVAAFVHEGEERVVVAWYGTHKQWWHYEIVAPYACTWEFWPDGQECPDKVRRKHLKESRAKADAP